MKVFIVLKDKTRKQGTRHFLTFIFFPLKKSLVYSHRYQLNEIPMREKLLWIKTFRLTLLSSLYFRSENKNNYYYHYCNRKDNVIKKTKGKNYFIIKMNECSECRIEEKILVITECAFPSIHSIQFNDDDYSE